MNNSEYNLACKLFLENIIKNNYGITDNELLTHDVIMHFEENISDFLNKNILFEETSINNECFYDVFNYINKNLKNLTKHKSLHIFFNFKTGCIEIIHNNKIYTISTQKTLGLYSFTLKRGNYTVKVINHAKNISDLQKILEFLIKLK